LRGDIVGVIHRLLSLDQRRDGVREHDNRD
jgi:hypothetical protein